MNSRFFTTSELRCSCGCGDMRFPDAFLVDLDLLRESYGSPLFLNSAFRCENHPAEKTKANGPGSHFYGAVDVRCYGAAAVKLVYVARGLGWTGFGVRQLGPIQNRYIHLDKMPARPHAPRPTIWGYAD